MFPNWLGKDTVVDIVGVVEDMLPAVFDARPQPQIFIAQGAGVHIGHVTIEGSHRIRQPLVETLNRIVGSDDLVGVMTPDMSPTDITTGSRTSRSSSALFFVSVNTPADPPSSVEVPGVPKP